jgi:hypothetical protein
VRTEQSGPTGAPCGVFSVLHVTNCLCAITLLEMRHGRCVAALDRGRIEADASSECPDFREHPAMIKSISAITLATHSMSRAVRFYRMLGFEIVYGGEDADLRAFGLEQVISISSPNLSSGIGPGGDVLSFTTRTSTRFMRT